jgi:hypothetical protein
MYTYLMGIEEFIEGIVLDFIMFCSGRLGLASIPLQFSGIKDRFTTWG